MRRLFLQITLLLLVQGVLMSATVQQIHVKTTQIPVIYESSDTLPIVSMRIVFKNAGALQDGSKPGLARITASLFEEGTKALGSTAFAKKLESKAIALDIHAGKESFVITLQSLNAQWPEAVTLLEELLDDPNYDEDVLDKVKTNAIGELMRKASDFDYLASTNLSRRLFENTPLAVPADGTPESIQTITLADVKGFIEANLHAARAIAVIGGDIARDSAYKDVTAVLGHFPQGVAPELPHFHVTPDAEDIRVIKETKQAYVYFGAPFDLNVTDPEAYKAKVAAFILGASGFGSRLMEEIRVKRGLAYSAYGRIQMSLSNSYFSGHLQTKTESEEEAVSLVREVVKAFVEGGATKKELQDAKNFLLGSEPLRTETLAQRLGRSLDEYYKGMPLGSSQKELEKIEALTLKELNAFIHAHPELTRLTFSIVTQ